MQYLIVRIVPDALDPFSVDWKSDKVKKFLQLSDGIRQEVFVVDH